MITELHTIWTYVRFSKIIIYTVLVNPLFAVAFYPISHCKAHFHIRLHTYGTGIQISCFFYGSLSFTLSCFSFVDFTEASCVDTFFLPVSFLVAAIFSAFFLLSFLFFQSLFLFYLLDFYGLFTGQDSSSGDSYLLFLLLWHHHSLM